MANEVRLIDANEIVKVAEHAYHEWCLSMVGADDTRKVNEVFKKQYLCKVVKAVAENCSTIDPETLRPKGEWTEIEGDYWNEDIIYQCSKCKEEFVAFDGTNLEKLWNYCPNCGCRMEE